MSNATKSDLQRLQVQVRKLEDENKKLTQKVRKLEGAMSEVADRINALIGNAESEPKKKKGFFGMVS